ncbi:TraV family lipoprotein [Mixta intestinalis]|uniref:TraV family lipoprotein n=1 Tax=Mixta intestinalis TaxID=1615494 RepID=UPI00136CA21F|nr:TraV family lipoprotein [Mixta intestinalis]
MIKTNPFLISILAVTLSGCSGMNSDFEFNEPAKDNGIWMSEADDMSAGSNDIPAAATVAGGYSNTGIRLNDYRLIDTGAIRLEPHNDVTADREYLTGSMSEPLASSGQVRPFTRENGELRTVLQQSAYCNAAHCFPEPTAAFRRPDDVMRIWIAPYVSPDNNVHMGEIIYSVSSHGDWNGILM